MGPPSLIHINNPKNAINGKENNSISEPNKISNNLFNLS